MPSWALLGPPRTSWDVLGGPRRGPGLPKSTGGGGRGRGVSLPDDGVSGIPCVVGQSVAMVAGLLERRASVRITLHLHRDRFKALRMPPETTSEILQGAPLAENRRYSLPGIARIS